MAKKLSTLSLALALLVLGVATTAGAAEITSVRIPFDFVVAGATYPAGTYTVTPTTNTRLVVIRNAEKPSLGAVVSLGPNGRNIDGKLELMITRKANAVIASLERQK